MNTCPGMKRVCTVILYMKSNTSAHKTSLRSGSQNCGKKSKIHHFLEIVQYTFNNTFLYQHFIGKTKKQRKIQISVSILAATTLFLRPCINLVSIHENLSKISKVFFKIQALLSFQDEIFKYVLNFKTQNSKVQKKKEKK